MKHEFDTVAEAMEAVKSGKVVEDDRVSLRLLVREDGEMFVEGGDGYKDITEFSTFSQE